MGKPQLAQFLKPVFTPPFRGLNWVVWGYFVFCFLINPGGLMFLGPIGHGSQIFLGNLPDNDDYLYLVQAIDLLKGQGWFDYIQHRMNPPDGTFVHFSHVLCLVYAVPIYLLSFLLGTTGAALVTAGIMPLVYLALFFMAIRWAAVPFIGLEWSGVTAYVALFATVVMYEFIPGHIDHHGLEAMFAVLALGGMARVAMEPDRYSWPLIAGYALATGLMIGLEILPVVLMLMAAMGVWSTIKGGAAAGSGLKAALALLGGSFVALLLTRAPGHILDVDLLAYSVVYVILIGCIAVCFAGVALASLSAYAWLRYVVAILLVSGTSLGFLYFFPALLHGPYGGMDDMLARLMLDNLTEARPGIGPETSVLGIILFLLWPGMALAGSAFFFRESEKNMRWAWALVALSLAATLLLASFYQVRFITYVQAFAVVPLACVLRGGWKAAGRKRRDGRLYTARFALLLIVGPLPMVLLPAVFDGRPFNTGVLLFPNPPAQNICDSRALAQMLSLPVYYGNRPHVIMNMLDSSTELLFRTPHSVLAAPYHENVGGNVDAITFFTTQDPEKAKAIIRRRGADLVVLCRRFAGMYVAPNAKTVLDERGRLMPGSQSLAQQLVNGKTPKWLKEVEFPLFGDMMLFEVRPEEKGRR